MSTPRCIGCGDPCRDGWDYCLHCHAWNDLYEAVRWGPLGLDQHRLRRAREYFACRRYAEPLESLLWKLTGRVAQLEQAAVPAMNDRLQRIEAELEVE